MGPGRGRLNSLNLSRSRKKVQNACLSLPFGAKGTIELTRLSHFHWKLAEFCINLRDRSKLHCLMAKLNGMSSRPSREFGLHLQIRLVKAN